jgi:hypothetical protein
MTQIERNRELFTTVQQKLQQEIAVLQGALEKLDRYSENPSDQWAYPIYEKLLARRSRLLDYLSA